MLVIVVKGVEEDTKTNPLIDPYGCHFSVVTDAAWNMHVLSVDGGAIVYSRYLLADKSWSTRTITGTLSGVVTQRLLPPLEPRSTTHPSTAPTSPRSWSASPPSCCTAAPTRPSPQT